MSHAPRYLQYLETPLGKMEIAANEQALTHVIFCGPHAEQANNSNAITQLASLQLTEYFAGTRREFDLPLAPVGTDFQQRVWQLLTAIPFGQSRSYGQLAELLQNPKAVRAVGGANGRNPLTIIVPCHRVIGASGKLTGYAGGVERKQWLLQHEGLTTDCPFNKEALEAVIHTRQAKTQFLS